MWPEALDSRGGRRVGGESKREAGRRRAKRGVRACVERLDARVLLADFTIVSGQTIASVMPDKGRDEFFFAGNTGESVIVSVSATTAPGFRPAVSLVSPNGTTLASSSALSGDRSTSFLFEGLPVSGTYRVLTTERFDAGGGAPYRLSVANIGPLATWFVDEDGRALTSGQSLKATMGAGDLDVYAFEAAVGDSFRMSVAETRASDFRPKIRVFGPTGAWLRSDAGETAATVALTNLPESGRYYVVVGDEWGDGEDTPYNLSFVQLGSTVPAAKPGEGGEIFSGETLTGTLVDGDLDVFTFDAPRAGLSMIASLVPTAATVPSSFRPRVNLYTPAGLLASFFEGPQLISGTFGPGKHTFVVHDGSGDGDGGEYRLSLVVIGPGVVQRAGEDGGELISGQTRSATITRGDYDVFTFQGQAGGSASVTMTESLPTAFTPQFSVYGPVDGERVGGNSGLQVASAELKNLPATGTYVLVAQDVQMTANGAGYTLRVTTAAPPPVAPRISTAASAVVNSRLMTASLRVGATDDRPESELTYTWSLVSGPGTATFAAGNGTNGAKAHEVTVSALGDYAFRVRVTDAGGSFVEGTTTARFVAAAATVTVTPGSVTVPLGSQQQFTVEVKDQLGLPFAGSVTWSVSGGGSINGTGLFSPMDRGLNVPPRGAEIVVTARVGDATGTALVTIGEASPVPPRITTSAWARVDGAQMRALTASLTVTASDDKPESELTYTWSMLDGPGSVVFGAANGTNAAKALEARVEALGTYRFKVRVTDTSGAWAESTATALFTAVATKVTVTPGDVTVSAGSTRQFTAVVLDQVNGVMAEGVTWSVSGGETISGSGLFTASSTGGLGEFVVTARAGDVTATAGVRVGQAGPSRVVPTIVTGAWADVDSLSMSAVLRVRATDDGPEEGLTYAWSVLEGPGGATMGSGVTESGVRRQGVSVTALGTYRFMVRVTDRDGNSAESTTSATFEAVPVSMTVTPGEVSVGAGESVQFTAVVKDQLGGVFTGAVTWWKDGGGTISETGQFTADAEGTGTYTVQAQVSGWALTATARVTLSGPDMVLLTEAGDGKAGSGDLVLTNLSLGRVATVNGAVIGGTTLRGSVLLRNSGGTAVTGATSVTLYLSSDDVASTGDRVLGTVAVPVNARARQQRSVSFTVTVPDGVSGSRRVVAVVNGDGAVGERSTMNNAVASRELTVSARSTNLAAASLKAAAGGLVRTSTGLRLRSATLTATLLNGSNHAFAGSVPVRFVFTDSTGGAPVELGAGTALLNLAPGKSKVFNFRVPVGAELAGRTGTVSVVLDPDGLTADANRSDNSASGQLSLPMR